MKVEAITEQALKLEPGLRAYIAEILLKSLDYSESWRQEIQKRCHEIDAEPSILIEGKRFMIQLKQH